MTLIVLLLLLAGTANAPNINANPALVMRLPACAEVHGNQASLCSCQGPLPAFNLTGLSRIVVDFCNVPVVGQPNQACVDVTGDIQGPVLRNLQFSGCKVGILGGFDKAHCTTRMQDNAVIEGSFGDVSSVPGSVAVVAEGWEQLTFRENPFAFNGSRAGLLLVGNMGGWTASGWPKGGNPIPFLSGNTQSCPTGQSQTVVTFDQTTFTATGGSPAIEVRGQVAEVAAFGLYTTTAPYGQAGAFAVSFLGPWDTDGAGKTMYSYGWNLGKGLWNNEAYAADFAGPVVNSVFMSSLGTCEQCSGQAATSVRNPPWSTPVPFQLVAAGGLPATPTPFPTSTKTPTPTHTATGTPSATPRAVPPAAQKLSS